jgi:hypothetical protein
LPPVSSGERERYHMPSTSKTVLSHVEVPTNLGIRQKGKWDIARAVAAPSFGFAAICGDAGRAAIASLFDK